MAKDRSKICKTSSNSLWAVLKKAKASKKAQDKNHHKSVKPIAGMKVIESQHSRHAVVIQDNHEIKMFRGSPDEREARKIHDDLQDGIKVKSELGNNGRDAALIKVYCHVMGHRLPNNFSKSSQKGINVAESNVDQSVYEAHRRIGSGKTSKTGTTSRSRRNRARNYNSLRRNGG